MIQITERCPFPASNPIMRRRIGAIDHIEAIGIATIIISLMVAYVLMWM